MAEKIWISDLCVLVKNSKIFPNSQMSLEERINTITRFIFIIFIIFLIFSTKFSLIYLLTCNIILLLIYFLQKRTMTKENFTQCQDMPNYTIEKSESQLPASFLNREFEITSNHDYICKQRPYRSFDDSYDSKNHNLAKGCHPRTKTSPIVVAPSHDLSVWKDNNFITHSHTNTQSNFDNYRSGYIAQECTQKEMFTPSEEYSESHKIQPSDRSTQKVYLKQQSTDQDANVMKTNGYHKKNIDYGIPSNMPVGNCNRSDSLKNLNHNLHTQIIQPGVYTTSEIIEPVNTMIGISHQQQLPPTSYNDADNLHYTQHDPANVQFINEPEEIDPVNTSNIYDPRLTGHGTSYRAYNHDMTGQTRFMYDDINAIRMPNYISRSKIDFADYADSYGPINEGEEMGNTNHQNIRQLTQDRWLSDNMQFRNDMTERLMRKNNAINHQRRLAPLHTMYR